MSLAVSVILPVYNGERYVAGAIESILAQTHQNFEFLIVDDGSTDRTPEIIAAYAERDARIVPIRQENQGQAAALNVGLRRATSDWVALIDADDPSYPHRLERQLAVVHANPRLRVLGTYAIEINTDGKPIGRLEVGPTTEAAFEALRASNDLVVLVHSSVLMHRPTILAVGGYTGEMQLTEDIDLWSRVGDEHLVLSLPEYLVQARMHPASKSHTNYFAQRTAIRWVKARQQARRAGRPMPSYAAFLRWEARQPWPVRLNRKRVDWTHYFAKQSWTAWTNGQRPTALAMLAGALVLDPPGVVRRFRARRARAAGLTD